MNNQSIRGMLVAIMILLPSVSGAEPSALHSSTPASKNVGQVIVQIGGRFCEYQPRRVEAALFGFHPVHQVEFLNDHGTLLIRYDIGRVVPEQLVASIEGAISSGIGCRAWVDRGHRPLSGS